jgi:6-pyruvoyltetrahydropterin/6-carboxytetrahydropterin synthase
MKEERMNYEISVEKSFSSAHALRGYKGKCENLHGHNWKIKVFVKGKKLNELGMLVDFTDIKDILSQVLHELDHKNLNEVKPFDKINPSAENLAAWIFEKMAAVIKKVKYKNISVSKVTVWESETSCATVSK